MALVQLPTSLLEWGAIVASYLIGSLPFGLILGLVFKGVDIRKEGSRNIGATNAGRVLGRPFAFVAFALDFAKGWVPSYLLGPLAAASPAGEGILALFCGAAAVAGHVWPVYLRFKGGKGVATACGAICGIDPLVFLGGGLAWLVTLGLSRFVGLASIVMSIAFPLLAVWRMPTRSYGIEVVYGLSLLTLLVMIRHRANIGRMLAGTEPRVGR